MGVGSFARSKGQRGEREVVSLLQPVVNEVYQEFGREAPELARNLMQSRNGGFDIAGLDWMALEVKRHETLQISAWWDQAKKQASSTQEPILIYRQNNKKWRVMMFGYLPAGKLRVRTPVDISIEAFLAFFRAKLRDMLNVQVVLTSA